MKTYYASGGLGDAYVILCKLYSVAQKEKVLCRHFTAQRELQSTIRQIYSLVPNVRTEFRKQRGSVVNICGAFSHSDLEAERREYGLIPEYYPVFNSVSLEHFNLPGRYRVLQMEAGAQANRKRRIDMKVVKRLIKNSKVPTVLIGGNSGFSLGLGTVDLRGKTNVSEVVGIIKNATRYYGRVGFLSFVAVSQKVLSTLFIGASDRAPIRARIGAVKEWEKFFVKRKI